MYTADDVQVSICTAPDAAAARIQFDDHDCDYKEGYKIVQQ